MLGYILIGLTCGVVGIFVGAIFQQQQNNVTMQTYLLKMRLANQAAGRLSAIIHRQRLTIRRLKELTPKSQITTAAAKTIKRPNLPS